MFYDVIVIGAGLAGLMAAEAAQARGARVLLLARGMGSLPLMSGCMDGLGYFPAFAQTPVSSPLGVFSRFTKADPRHPYAILGLETVLASLHRFQELTRSGGIPYEGDFAHNTLLPTSLGTFRPACLIPRTMRAGDLSLPGRVLLLGFEGLRDFHPLWAAENLNHLHNQGKIVPTFRAEILGNLDPKGRAQNSLRLARDFEEMDFQERFLRRVKPLLKDDEKVGVPSVLGYHSSREVWERLQEELDTEIFEIPLPPPSVPGLRCYNHLTSHLQEKGIRIIVGLSRLEPIFEFGKIRGFSLGGLKRSPAYQASAFVLATGKFVGGGLDSNRGRIFETLLDLPVRYPGDRREWFNAQFLGLAGQPFNSFGVEVDENLRPVGVRGEVLYANLFAAGGIIAHANSMSEKSGGGVAIATGYRAGMLAAAQA